MSERTFIAEARYDSRLARWDVWAWEQDYQGVATDGDVPGERQRSGAGWTHEHLVCHRRTERGARRAVKRALRQAEANARARRIPRYRPDPIRRMTTKEDRS